ncbi:HNH endonuclease [Nocardioides carbamazepini]|uniref:HNH endonuclease signature motif containing protein n=1 Tax=Nocardioides carbamazepini TaxID=2854259 RepID=UPI002149B46E|nr:HNH endonuclease signature motif containing protein [Nocardioides carbamazepini]MCR1786050.1 HNH endonuclease [Nocardioides carbamazepini]
MTVAPLVQQPLLAAVADARASLDQVADLQPLYLSITEKEQLLVESARLAAQVDELRLRCLAEAGDVAEAHGARDAGAWLAHTAQLDPAAARADVHLAAALQTRPLVAAAMRTGAVNAAQARVITAAVDDLPEQLGPDLRADAEARLVDYADEFGPAELRRLGRRILDVLAPQIAEEEEAKRLEAEEAAARDRATLRFRNLGDGRSRMSGVLPTSTVERLKGYLDAHTNPARHTPTDPDTEADAGAGPTEDANPDVARSPFHRRRAWALMDLLELLDPDRLPQHGGDATAVTVTIGLDQLRADLATAGLLTSDGEETISASEARRLACQARIIPVVLDGHGRVLDLGRSARLFQPAQRAAIRLRDHACRAEGCTIPARWCHLHHLDPWSGGGTTDLDLAVTLCGHHHQRIHDHRYTHQRLPDGDIRFHRRN